MVADNHNGIALPVSRCQNVPIPRYGYSPDNTVRIADRMVGKRRHILAVVAKGAVVPAIRQQPRGEKGSAGCSTSDRVYHPAQHNFTIRLNEKYAKSGNASVQLKTPA